MEHAISGWNRELERQLSVPRGSQGHTDETSGSSRPEETIQRLSMALRTRLEMIHPHIDTWPQVCKCSSVSRDETAQPLHYLSSKALAVATQSRNLGHSSKLLFQLIDSVWHAAGGDHETDSSWYSKRAMLAGVYVSSELYMLTDHSPGYEETWKVRPFKK